MTDAFENKSNTNKATNLITEKNSWSKLDIHSNKKYKKQV
jgi:hypothetical protein